MANQFKISLLSKLTEDFGKIKKLSYSLSLFDLNEKIRVYIRYSKLHPRKQAFYGLRKEDLLLLNGKNSFIIFIDDNSEEPIFIPYDEFEDIFSSLETASDGQIKVSIFHQESKELYISNVGRFNIERFVGWRSFTQKIQNVNTKVPKISHSQAQTLIGYIGNQKGYEIWIPKSDRISLDWNYCNPFPMVNFLPKRYENIEPIIKGIDVIWILKGASELKALFEVEHSTPVYSGLLRFNDLYLTEPNLKNNFSIVSNSERRSLFSKQVNRPTFKRSGLSELCSFLEYSDLYGWYERIYNKK